MEEPGILKIKMLYKKGGTCLGYCAPSTPSVR